MKKNSEISNLPTPSTGGLSVYLAQIKKFPMLDAEEEYVEKKLERKWKFSISPQTCYKPFKISC